MSKARDFFYENAPFSYQPPETCEEGNDRNAVDLATAEVYAAGMGWRVVWEVDPDTTSRDWTDDGPETPTYLAALHYNGKVLATLGGIDFGTNEPHDGSDAGLYARVVEAQLAREAMEDAGWNPDGSGNVPDNMED